MSNPYIPYLTKVKSIVAENKVNDIKTIELEFKNEEDYNKFDYILAVSDFTVDELKKIGIKKKIFVIENGINNETFKFDDEKGIAFRKEYGFNKNKGYGTASHIKELKKHGPCPVHRLSFKRVK